MELHQKTIDSQYAMQQPQSVQSSIFWRITSIPRRFFDSFPHLRNFIRRTLKLCWWIITLQLLNKIAERRLSQSFYKCAPKYHSESHTIRIIYISGEPNTPGHLYRVVRYAEAAIAAGFETHIIPIENVSQEMAIISKANLIVIWRALWSKKLEKVINLSRLSNIKIIFDVDDSMIEPDLAKINIIDGIRSQGLDEKQTQAFFEKIHMTFSNAHIYTAPTHFLAKRMRGKGLKPALVLPNGFDENTLLASRLSVRMRRKLIKDDLIRIGYASGSPTHQKDFSQIVSVITRLLSEYSKCRLVLFHQGEVEFLKISEFLELHKVINQIEWRSIVPLIKLPEEMARFDINIAPLESDNIYCNSKSELKYFEAALVEVPTVASPTAPYRRAIQDGITGFLAQTADEWYEKLKCLIENKNLRHNIGRAAFHDVLWTYGPERRIELMNLLVDLEYHNGQRLAHAFELLIAKHTRGQISSPVIPAHEILLEIDTLKPSSIRYYTTL